MSDKQIALMNRLSKNTLIEMIVDMGSEIDILKKALERIANTPDDYEMEYCRNIAIMALEELI